MGSSKSFFYSIIIFLTAVLKRELVFHAERFGIEVMNCSRPGVYVLHTVCAYPFGVLWCVATSAILSTSSLQ